MTVAPGPRRHGPPLRSGPAGKLVCVRRSGTAELPLHSGRAPRWLFERMVRLSLLVVEHICADQGAGEVLGRLSDPFWFQAFGCVLGFDWHSSGLTTTTCGALKEALRGAGPELGLYVAGGKGRVSCRTPAEIAAACEGIGLEPAGLVRASRTAAKVDNSAVQSGHQLYHHVFVFTAAGKWCVVQQGMNESTRTARRFHWLGEHVSDFVEEPHEAVCDDRRGVLLNYVAGESARARDVAAELARGGPGPVLEGLDKLPEPGDGPPAPDNCLRHRQALPRKDAAAYL